MENKGRQAQACQSDLSWERMGFQALKSSDDRNIPWHQGQLTFHAAQVGIWGDSEAHKKFLLPVYPKRMSSDSAHEGSCCLLMSEIR